MAKKNTKKIDPIEEKEENIEEELVEDFVVTEEESVSISDETPEPEVKPDSEVEEKDETPVEMEDTPDVKYREVVYLGVADICKRAGAVTGVSYSFTKDTYGMPKATYVDERDYPAIISERGRGCARRDPSLLFMSKLEWDLEIEQARIANNS